MHDQGIKARGPSRPRENTRPLKPTPTGTTMETITWHQTVNGKYEFVLERAAVKGILGYKIRVNSDYIEVALAELARLKDEVEAIAVELPGGIVS